MSFDIIIIISLRTGPRSLFTVTYLFYLFVENNVMNKYICPVVYVANLREDFALKSLISSTTAISKGKLQVVLQDLH